MDAQYPMVMHQQSSLYRKYRPRLWDEVSGQERVVQVLRNSIKRVQVSHAYLFCGQGVQVKPLRQEFLPAH